MAPPETLLRRVEVEGRVAVAVVVAVVAGPPQGTLLCRRSASEGQDELEDPVGLVTAMREVPVVTPGDEEHPAPEQGEEQHHGCSGDAGPEAEQDEGVDQEEREAGLPVDALFGGPFDAVEDAQWDLTSRGRRPVFRAAYLPVGRDCQRVVGHVAGSAASVLVGDGRDSWQRRQLWQDLAS